MSEKQTDPDPEPLVNSSSSNNLAATATLYISNVSEDVWSFISEISDVSRRQYEIGENSLLSDRDLLCFAGKHNARIILPHAVDETFWQYYIKTFGNKNVEVWVPEKHTGEISNDIANDEKLLQKIVEFAKQTKKLNIVGYSTSYQFLSLVKKLKELGVPVSTPQSPEEADAWTVNFYGSKSGIRQLAQQSAVIEPDMKMSYGMVSSGIIDTAKIAAKMYVKEHGVVLKINKGHSGAGMFIWREGDLPSTFNECEQAILTHLKKDKYWEKFPIVVEELVNINLSLGGGNPNVEFKILKNGEVKFLYFCGMRVTKDGVFKGVEIHKDALSEKVVAQMTDTGFYIGEQYASQGYRGYFDVDFVAAKNGELYVTESNVRRTGGTHVYHVAKDLFGSDFMYEVFTLSNNIYQLPNTSIKSFDDLMKRLEPVLFSKTAKEGVVIACANLLERHEFGYVIFGKTKNRALEIETQMEDLLQQQ
jgi:hypothetical protein